MREIHIIEKNAENMRTEQELMSRSSFNQMCCLFIIIIIIMFLDHCWINDYSVTPHDKLALT